MGIYSENLVQYNRDLKKDLQGYNDMNSLKSAFILDRCEFLKEQGLFDEYHIVEYDDNDFNCAIDAWGLRYDDVDKIGDSLVLVLSDYSEEDSIESKTLGEFTQYLMKAKRFHTRASKNNLAQSLSQGSPEHALAKHIQDNIEDTVLVTVVGITNKVVTTNKKTILIRENQVNEITFNYDVWDLPRFEKVDKSVGAKESVDILFEDFGKAEGIPALKASIPGSRIDSYLFALPAGILADIYEIWNDRLLEQNPRTFLQFSGKVNQGMRITLMNDPEKFFNYNNGISAVARSVTLSPNERNIVSIENFQIVNGGQTTASIYNTRLKAIKNKNVQTLELFKAFVMVKLSVISDDTQASELIPNISLYSNSQTKVSVSAFSARHPFHLGMESLSRDIWTSGKTPTHWYYERVQGQYRNSLNLKKTKSERDRFQIDNPKEQWVKTTDAAKIIMAFEQKPSQVCLGAQKCYGVFCKEFLDKLSKDDVGKLVTENYFKEFCVKALLFRTLEKRVSQGVRFVVVPYTIAFVESQLESMDLRFNYKALWQKQWENAYLFSLLTDYSKEVLNWILESIPTPGMLISEWGKRLNCWWDYVQKHKLDLSALTGDKNFVWSIDDYQNWIGDGGTGLGVIDTDPEIYVANKGFAHWQEYYAYASKNMKLSPGEAQYIRTATTKVPTSKIQLKGIMKAEERIFKDMQMNGYKPSNP